MGFHSLEPNEPRLSPSPLYNIINTRLFLDSSSDGTAQALRSPLLLLPSAVPSIAAWSITGDCGSRLSSVWKRSEEEEGLPSLALEGVALRPLLGRGHELRPYRPPFV